MSEEIRRLRLLSYNNLKLIASAMVASAIPSTADAGIVYFDLNPDVNLGLNQGLSLYNIDLTNESFSQSGSITTQGNWLFIQTQPSGDGGYLAGNLSFADISGDLVPFTLGSPIDGSPSWSNSISFYDGPWPSGETRYVGLRIDAGGNDYNYGWLSLNATASVGATITGFAFEKTLNTPILAGDTGEPSNVIPEPGSVAIVTGLFGLMVGANRRARRAKKASVPDALLNLAAGARGVEKFREVNAA